VAPRRFGISTHLFHESRLAREHLQQIAAHGFREVELFATRSHVDYHDDRAIGDVADWLSESGLELHSVHAPIFECLESGRRSGLLSNASADERRRGVAVTETRAALHMARRIPFRCLVVHLGIVPGEAQSPDDNRPEAARRSIEEIAGLAAESGVRVAIELIPNPLSESAMLVRLIEEQLEGVDVGVCFDYGHAHLMGDLGDAIEGLSGHVWTTHVHDNRGQRDEHLVPFAGTIDWDAAMMETQKIGYDGVLMFEVAGSGDPLGVLQRTARARERLEKAFVTF